MGENVITYHETNWKEIEEYYPLIEKFVVETNADSDAMRVLLYRIENDKNHCFLAKDGKKVIGMSGYCPAGDHGVAEILYVLPEYRGKTIAGALLQKSFEHARENGISKATLMVSDDREKLYTKLGFKRKFILLEKEI